MQSHEMQQKHTHKAVAGRVEAKNLLSRRRKSDFSCFILISGAQILSYNPLLQHKCLLTPFPYQYQLLLHALRIPLLLLWPQVFARQNPRKQNIENQTNN